MSERPRRGKLDREPDPEKHPELGPELTALYAAWLDAVKEFRVYRCDIADRADVEANLVAAERDELRDELLEDERRDLDDEIRQQAHSGELAPGGRAVAQQRDEGSEHAW